MSDMMDDLDNLLFVIEGNKHKNFASVLLEDERMGFRIDVFHLKFGNVWQSHYLPLDELTKEYQREFKNLVAEYEGEEE